MFFHFGSGPIHGPIRRPISLSVFSGRPGLRIQSPFRKPGVNWGKRGRTRRRAMNNQRIRKAQRRRSAVWTY